MIPSFTVLGWVGGRLVVFCFFGIPSWLVAALMSRCAARMNIGWPGADGLFDLCVDVVGV